MGNCCPGGFCNKKKKKVVIEERAGGPVEYPILPIEVWDVIFERLKNDTRDLLSCRLVCRGFKVLADGFLHGDENWTPHFPYISSLPLIFIGGYGETIVRRSKGTRFSSGASVRHFLEAMEDHSGNPFPYGTVLVYPNPDLCLPSSKRHHKLYKKFPKIVEQFGDRIFGLEYCVRDDVVESIHGLRSIFEMDNLRSLTVYTRDWNQKKVRNGLLKLNHDLHSKILPSRNGFVVCPNSDGEEIFEMVEAAKEGCLEHLENLQIMGSNGILPLNYLFAPFGEQIKSLYFCFMDDTNSLNSMGYAAEPRIPSDIDPLERDGLTYSIAELTPNITKLKVYEVNEDLMDKIMPRVGPENEGKIKFLQHLSIKLQRPFFRPLNRLCTAIDEHCADTLVSLHLEISRWPPRDPHNREDRELSLLIDSSVKLEKLEDLAISYSLYLQEPEFLYRFSAKCPKLKNLTFISVNIHSGSFPDLNGFCNAIWRKLPKTLKAIHVKYWISRDFLPENSWPQRSSDENIPSPKTYYHFKYAPQRLALFRRQPRYCQAEPVPRLQICPRPQVINMESRRRPNRNNQNRNNQNRNNQNQNNQNRNNQNNRNRNNRNRNNQNQNNQNRNNQNRN